MKVNVQDLIILTYADYLQLRRDLKANGIDLCYAAQAGRPIRLDWSPDLFTDPVFLEEVAERRPQGSSFRIVSVVHTKKGSWFRPDEFAVTFHGTGALQEAALDQYLSEHQVQSSRNALKARLTRV